MDDKNHKNTCMACSCPCDMHKEHTYDTGGDEHIHMKRKKRRRAWPAVAHARNTRNALITKMGVFLLSKFGFRPAKS